MRPEDQQPGRRSRRGQTKVRPQPDVSYEDLGPVTPRAGRRGGGSRSRRVGLSALIVLLVLIAAGGAAVTLALHNRSTSANVAALRRPDSVVIFVLDGVTADDFQRTAMPNLAALERAGMTYSRAWVGQLEATPTASNATIATGVYPRRHGILGALWRDAHTHALVRSTDSTQVRLGALDQILESNGVTPLADLIKTRYPSARVLSVGGSGCSAASAAGTWIADYVLCPVQKRGRWAPGAETGHSAPAGLLSGRSWTVPIARKGGLAPLAEGWRLGQENDWIARTAVRVMRSTRPRLTILNFPEAATLMRWAPARQRRTVLRQVLTGVDRDIGMVLRELRRERAMGRTAFVVTSDGGVVPATDRVPVSTLDEAILASGGEKTYIDADGSAMIGLRDRLEAPPVAEAVQAEQMRQVDAIYYKTTSSSGWTYRMQYVNPRAPVGFSGATNYLLSTLASANAPDVAVIYAPHVTTGNARLGRYRWTGAGDAAQWANQHIPLVIAGQGTMSGRSRYPARLVDITPTLEALMGLGTAKVDGIALADALPQPPSGAVERQQRTNRRLAPLVGVLIARAGARGS